MNKLEEIRAKLERWREEYPRLIQPEREHTANIEQFELLLHIVERQRKALGIIDSVGMPIPYDRIARECIAEVDKLAGGKDG